MNKSFGFSVSGPKAKALELLKDVPTDGRPDHAPGVLTGMKEILEALPDNASVSITVNTLLEDPKPSPVAAPVMDNEQPTNEALVIAETDEAEVAIEGKEGE